MKRKINKVGDNTLTVSLPSKWAKLHNLKKGDELEISISSDHLNVYTLDKKQEKIIRRINFNVTDISSTFIKFVMVTFLRSGFNELKLTFDNKFVEYTSSDKDIVNLERCSTSKLISDFCNIALMGFQVIDQGSDYILIKQILDVRKDEIDNIVRKVFLHIKNLIEDSVIAVKNKNIERIKNLRMIEPNTNRWVDYCKMIILSDKHNFEKNIKLNELLSYVELLGDEWEFFLKCFQRNPKISNNLIEILEKISALFEKTYEDFYKFDKNKLIDWHLLKEDVKNDINSKMLVDDKFVYTGIVHTFLSLISHINNVSTEYNYIKETYLKDKK